MRRRHINVAAQSRASVGEVFGLLANGTAVAWGDDEFGQLGDGKEESIASSNPDFTSAGLCSSVLEASRKLGTAAGCSSGSDSRGLE